MKITSIAGFAVIAEDPAPSKALYQDLLGLPMKAMDDYIYVDRFSGAHHFGVWPLRMAAQACFGADEWPDAVPKPTVTIEFELEDIESVAEAVEEMKAKGYTFVHESRMEPWGQTIARFMSPEGVLVGLSYAPWLHQSQ